MGRWTRRWTAMRAVVFALLLLPLALSRAFPTLARWCAGPQAHVCHCEVHHGHSDCACPICHPDVPEYRLGEPSIRGKCGDDDLAFGGSHGAAVLPATVSVREPPPRAVAIDRDALRVPDDVDRAPPTPPPRTITA